LQSDVRSAAVAPQRGRHAPRHDLTDRARLGLIDERLID
jgi:hypothetical protein